jgi:S-adenosylmethionine:tRNA ribosyltransferase-isomerase
VLNKSSGRIEESRFAKIGGFLKKGDLLVINDSKVIKARLFAKKPSGGKVEVLLVRPEPGADGKYDVSSVRWEALIKPSRGLQKGHILDLNETRINVLERLGQGMFKIGFEPSLNIKRLLSESGKVPIPPYIIKRRKLNGNKEYEDDGRYQTVYANAGGSVAAPTAGFHFDEEIIEQLKVKGIEFVSCTLHVGPGTFKPVKAEDIREHYMDKEWFTVSAESLEMVVRAKEEGRRVIAVGTTSCRVLETVFAEKPHRRSGYTDLFIYPGFDFKCIDAIITNFHIPGSTLILLVSAFAGKENIFKAYEYAINNEFRFYSYGDAMFIS